MVKRTGWPEVNEFVLATVKKIVPHGAYVQLDEYMDKEGMIHISEVSSRWIRNIRSSIRENQKVVVKVLRVDERRSHIDLSIRRTTEQQRREKILEWKRGQKAENLLEMAAKKMKKSSEEAYREAGWKMEDAFGEIYAGFEEAFEKGAKPLKEAGISEKWTAALTEVAKAYVEIPTVAILGQLKLICPTKDGVNTIKEALLEAAKQEDEKGKVKTYTLGAPLYKLEVTSKDYKAAEETLEKAVQAARKTIEESGGELHFERER